jgi:hypothetical protein
MWYDRAATSRCLFFGEQDGTMQAVSGCPRIELAATRRPDGAVALIAKAVLTREQGAPLASMEVSADQRQLEDIQPTPTRLPARIVPPAMPTEAHRALSAKHRPDHVLLQDTKPPAASQIHIRET